MIVVYPDTNVFFADHLMRREGSRAFLDLLSRHTVEVRLSPVVVAEAKRQTRERADKLSQEITGAFANAQRSFPIDEARLHEFTASVAAEMMSHAEAALKPLLDDAACKVIGWSEVSAEELVRRELERRKPMLETGGGQTIGMRDTVIWHGFLETAARLDADDHLIFVSNDKGFVENGALHPSLLAEVEALDGIPTDNVCVATSLGEANLEIRRLAKLATEREEVLVDALVDWVYALDDYSWEGYPTSNDVVAGSTLPDGMEDVVVEVVPMLNVYEVGEGNPARCVASNELLFRARMSGFGFFESTDDRLTMIGNAPSSNDIAVEFRVTADIEAEIDYDPETKYARVLSGSVSWGS